MEIYIYINKSNPTIYRKNDTKLPNGILSKYLIIDQYSKLISIIYHINRCTRKNHINIMTDT